MFSTSDYPSLYTGGDRNSTKQEVGVEVSLGTIYMRIDSINTTNNR